MLGGFCLGRQQKWLGVDAAVGCYCWMITSIICHCARGLETELLELQECFGFSGAELQVMCLLQLSNSTGASRHTLVKGKITISDSHVIFIHLDPGKVSIGKQSH